MISTVYKVINEKLIALIIYNFEMRVRKKNWNVNINLGKIWFLFGIDSNSKKMTELMTQYVFIINYNISLWIKKK